MQVRVAGRFQFQARPEQHNWLVLFQDLCPEADLDRMLNAIATELGGKMYIEPAIPLSELTFDDSSFFFTIDVFPTTDAFARADPGDAGGRHERREITA